ncbi:MAG: hypothetical protein EHM72_05525 [Calditrichaeota bacterium]|nr:MAG: hypothetical protein EHM72_05525 [Calditrichota bacterium]
MKPCIQFMSILIHCCIYGVLIVSSSFSAEKNRVYETNRAYKTGDWITYGVNRFVRHIDIGEPYVYFATTGGITRINMFNHRWDFPWTKSNGLASDDILLVAKDKNSGYLWAVSDVGVSYQEPANERWFNLYYDEMNLQRDRITSFGIGENYQVFFVTAENRWFASSNTAINFSEIDAHFDDRFIEWHGDLAPSSGTLPYFFMDGGYLFNEHRRYIDDLDFRHWQITDWLRDGCNNLWIATWGLGIGVGDLNTYRMEMIPYGLWSEAVDAIAEDEDIFWCGGVQSGNEAEGATGWDEKSGWASYYEPHLIYGFDNAEITSIAADERFVLFGTSAGLTVFDKHKNHWRTYTVANRLANDQVHQVVMDHNDIWIATAGGVSRLGLEALTGDSLNFRTIQFPSLRLVNVYDLAVQENLLWLATEFGIYVYDKLLDSGGYYKGNEGPFDRPVYAVSVWQDEVWFGAEDGIYAIDSKTKQWLIPPAEKYVTKVGINRILASRSVVWVATNQGLLKYDRAGQRWIIFTQEDGLDDDRVYSLLLEGDYLYLGGPTGLTRFYWNAPYRID